MKLPPEVIQYSQDIRRFLDAMICKLASNAHKGRWEKASAAKAWDLLCGEIKELHEALERGNMVEIMLESADVANFALILSAIAMERGVAE